MSERTQELIKAKCKALADLLCQKNKAYGDSAMEPIGVFSKLPAKEAILIRMDDKLSRIRNGAVNALGEDSYWDLAGYLILLLVSEDIAAGKGKEAPVTDPAHRCRKMTCKDCYGKDAVSSETILVHEDEIRIQGKTHICRLSWEFVLQRIREHFYAQVRKIGDATRLHVYGVPRGGAIVAGLASAMFPQILVKEGMPKDSDPSGQHEIVVDDIVETGKTMREATQDFNIPSWSVVHKEMDEIPEYVWIHFPWENEPRAKLEEWLVPETETTRKGWDG